MVATFCLPEPRLTSPNRSLPGTASGLHRHEWIKHGTCHRAPGGADEYYDDTLLLMERINGPEIAGLIAARVGRHMHTAELRAAFDAAFGPGAGNRVEVRCTNDDGRRLIQELRIHLRGVIEPGAEHGALLAAADPVPPGCNGGIVDPAGLQ